MVVAVVELKSDFLDFYSSTTLVKILYWQAGRKRKSGATLITFNSSFLFNSPHFFISILSSIIKTLSQLKTFVPCQPSLFVLTCFPFLVSTL